MSEGPTDAGETAPKLDRTRAPPEQRRRVLRRLLASAIRPHWPVLAAALLCMVVVAAMTAASAALMDPVVNRVFVDRDRSMLWLVGGAVAATFLIKSLASYGQDTLLAFVGQRVIANLQNRLFRHLLAQDVALFQTRHTGSFVSHFTFDVNAMRSAVSTAIVAIGRDTLSVVFLIGVMFYQDWVLSLVTLIVAPLTAVPIDRLAKRLKRVSLGIQVEMGRLNALLSQSFQALRVIKSFNREAYEAARMEALVSRLFRLSWRAARTGAATQPILDSMGGLAVAIVIVYGGLRVVDGVTTAGAFFSFITAVLMAYQPMRSLAKVLPSLQDGLAAGERIFGLLDRPAPADPGDARAVPRIAGRVVFDRVGFGYEGGPPALREASFVAEAGQVTALVGPSGAGKSTVFGLIPRFYRADSGSIAVNGCPVDAVTAASLRDAMAIVGQDVVLFDDTVMANIRYGREDAGEAEIVEACKAAAADEFIRALPQGYETIVGERGLRLSGGQRQRLAIARAILKDAPILLLDEATSALDTESERHIRLALGRLMRGRTTLVIAHRLSTIRDADMIHVMDGGRIVESGSHDDLMARRGGLYARLQQLQLSGDLAGAA